MRAKDQTGNAFKSLKSSITGVKGILTGLGIAALVHNIDEAEKAASQLDAAFKATGKTLGLTRQQLDDLSVEMQKTTRFSDDLTKQAEAVLLTFDRVRGDAFGRTIKVAADLATRLGSDLPGAVRQLGLALQDPEHGLQRLQRAGVVFDDSQKNLIKTLNDVGRTADAQKIILSELERRFGGSAIAARNTLGGALIGLKNTFSDLFEGTKESTSGAVEAINSLNETLSNPKLKEAIDSIIGTFAEGAKKIAEFGGGIRVLAEDFAALTHGAAAGDIIRLQDQLAIAEELRKTVKTDPKRIRFFGKDGFIEFYNNEELDTTIRDLKRKIAEAMASATPSAAGGAGGAAGAAPLPVVVQLEEIRVTAHKLVDEYGDLMQQFRDETRTTSQSAAADYLKLKTTLQFLRDQGVDRGGISQEEFQKRLGGALDDLLPEFDLNEIRAKYQTLKAATSELGEFMKGVWQEVGRSIQSTLSDAIYNWNLSWRSLIDIARRALADIASAIITSGIQNQLKALFGGYGGGDQSALADSFFAFLGSKAGGGRFDGPTMVGEDGPELLMGSGTVMNKRQMAFAGMGGGANINYAPTFNLNIESSGDRDTEARMAAFVDTRIAQSQQEFARTLQRSGVQVKG